MKLRRVLAVLLVVAAGLVATAVPATADPLLPPRMFMSFNPSTVALAGQTQLNISVDNLNDVNLQGVSFVDQLPAGLVAVNPGSRDFCGGVLSITANSISLTGGFIPRNLFCTTDVPVQGTTLGPKLNTAAASALTVGTGDPATARLVVGSPPTITKAFGTSPITVGSSTSLTFTLTNPNAADLNDVAFTDPLPAGLMTSLDTASHTCGSGKVGLDGSNPSTFAFRIGTILASSSCTVTITVTGVTAGTKTNTTSELTTSEGLTGTAASASLVVQPPPQPPTAAKRFQVSTIPLNGTTVATVEVANPNATTTLTGVSVTDTLPPGLVAIQPGSGSVCGGTSTVTANSISLTNATVGPDIVCAVSALVQGTTAGTKVNTTTAPTSTNGGTGTAASATLVVQPARPPTLAKAFTPSTVAVGGTTTLTFMLTNPNPFVPLSRITFADALPGGIAVAVNPSVVNTCGGVPSVGPFALAVAYANASLPPGGSCTFSVNVTATSAGVKTNTTAIVSSSAGIGSPATGTLTVTP